MAGPNGGPFPRRAGAALSRVDVATVENGVVAGRRIYLACGLAARLGLAPSPRVAASVDEWRGGGTPCEGARSTGRSAPVAVYSVASEQPLAHWDFDVSLAYFEAAIIAAGIIPPPHGRIRPRRGSLR